MARSKRHPRFPLKPAAYALLALAVGLALLILSWKVKPSEAPEPEAPATAPATAPAGQPQDGDSSRSREEAAAENLSGLLLLFSAAGFLLCLICIGWLVVEIRKGRPAWKTQKKYPKMR